MNLRARIFIFTATVVAAAVGCYFFDPTQWAFLPGCPLHALTGLHCPGCGSTRALHQLAHGHLGAAFGLNPLAVGALPVLGFFALRGRALRSADLDLDVAGNHLRVWDPAQHPGVPVHVCWPRNQTNHT